MFFISTACSAQLSNEAILFKAKMLTTYRYGAAEQSTILNELNSQQSEFLTNDSSEIVIIKIAFAQRNFKGENRDLTWIGSCDFYIGYNRRLFKYYRLGGFDCLDVKDFFYDLKSREHISLLSDENLNRKIDLLCLNEYAEARSGRKKKKIEARCIKKCSEELSDHTILK
jgi:hypothetical protein